MSATSRPQSMKLNELPTQLDTNAGDIPLENDLPAGLDRGYSKVSFVGSASHVLIDGPINCMALHKAGLFLGSNDAKVHHIDLKGATVAHKKTIASAGPIASLSFNPSHSRLAIGCTQGSLQVLEMEKDSLKILFNQSFGDFAFIDTLCPGSDYCVTLRESGIVQIWKASHGELVQTISLAPKLAQAAAAVLDNQSVARELSTNSLYLSRSVSAASEFDDSRNHTMSALSGRQSRHHRVSDGTNKAISLACSPSYQVAAIGDELGFVYMIDLSDLQKSRVVNGQRLSLSGIAHLTFSPNGHILIAAGKNGHIFVIDGRPSSKFRPLGHIGLTGQFVNVSTFYDDKHALTRVAVAVSSKTSVQQQQPLVADNLVIFNVPDTINDEPFAMWSSLRGDLKKSVTNLTVLSLQVPVCHVAFIEATKLVALTWKSKKIDRKSVV